ncbi:hypothetical protein HDU82_005078 [Entophlyctis luteolus]|nr:hypothetical protein HDU82_005078 [Entophlyctis luteolus]
MESSRVVVFVSSLSASIKIKKDSSRMCDLLAMKKVPFAQIDVASDEFVVLPLSGVCFKQPLKQARKGILERKEPSEARALFRDRIAHTEQCSPEVLSALGSPYFADASSASDEQFANDCADPYACRIEWIVYATSCSRGLNRLAKLVSKAAGIKLTILGMQTGWRGWGQRIRAYHDYLSLSDNPSRVVVLSDGDDVILVPGCSGSDILEGYLKSDGGRLSPIFFEAVSSTGTSLRSKSLCLDRTGFGIPGKKAEDDQELRHPTQCLILTDQIAQSPPGSPPEPPSIFPYLNAGALIGRAGDIQALIKKVYTDDCIDDQRAFIAAYLEPQMWWSTHPRAAELVDKVERAMRNVSLTEDAYGTGSAEHTRARARMNRAALEKITLEASGGYARMQGGAATTSGGVPEHARPLIEIDFDQDLFYAMYDVGMGSMDMDNATRRVRVKRTGGRPCILHQSGTKRTNRVLEEVSARFGLSHDAQGIAASRQLQAQRPDETARWDQGPDAGGA